MDNIREYLRNRIAFYLEQKHLTQKELADFLGVSQSTTTDWIKGKNSPNIERVAKMCELFDCKISDLIDPMKQTNSYGPYKNVFQKYIRLDDHGKRVADYIINEEYNRLYPPTKSDKSEQPTIEIIFIDNALASAGIGEMIGDIDQEKISVPETPTTRRADFAIRVRGDSMEPEYYDDDIVLVRKTDYVDKGDIGIFVVDGETYIKKCGGDRLISLNPKYPDITGDEETRIYTMGEVIGKL